MSVIFTNCAECGNFRYNRKSSSYFCSAFPDGIPKEYMFRKNQNKNDNCNKDIKFVPENNK